MEKLQDGEYIDNIPLPSNCENLNGSYEMIWKLSKRIFTI